MKFLKIYKLTIYYYLGVSSRIVYSIYASEVKGDSISSLRHRSRNLKFFLKKEENNLNDRSLRVYNIPRSLSGITTQNQSNNDNLNAKDVAHAVNSDGIKEPSRVISTEQANILSPSTPRRTLNEESISNPCLSVSLDCDYGNRRCDTFETLNENLTCNTGNPQQLGWVYRGTLCSDSDNNQEFYCEDFSTDEISTQTLHISVTGKETKDTYFNETVLRGEDIYFENLIDDNIVFEIYKDDSSESKIFQRMIINVECKGTEELTIGETFGAFQLVSITDQNGFKTEGFKKLAFTYLVQNVSPKENEIISIKFDLGGYSTELSGSKSKTLDTGESMEATIVHYLSVKEPGYYLAKLSVVSNNGETSTCSGENVALVVVEGGSTEVAPVPTNAPVIPTNAPVIEPLFSCARPSECKTPSCQIQCPLDIPEGFYPDLTDCASFCQCSGTIAPSKYEECQNGLYFDPLNTKSDPQWLPWPFGIGTLWGSKGGICNWPNQVNNDRPPGCKNKSRYQENRIIND